MISRRLPASSSLVLAAARLRALQLDPRPHGEKTGQLRGRIQKNSQPSPAARVVTGSGSYALLTVVALMGAAWRASPSRGCGCPLGGGAGSYHLGPVLLGGPSPESGYPARLGRDAGAKVAG